MDAEGPAGAGCLRPRSRGMRDRSRAAAEPARAVARGFADTPPPRADLPPVLAWTAFCMRLKRTKSQPARPHAGIIVVRAPP